MSGAGGGGAYESGEVSCELISLTTALASPNPKVQLKVGDLLRVAIEKGSVPVAVCVTADGEIAGSLAYGEVRQLIKCMEEGHEYQAEVLSVNGGHRQVEISHR